METFKLFLIAVIGAASSLKPSALPVAFHALSRHEALTIVTEFLLICDEPRNKNSHAYLSFLLDPLPLEYYAAPLPPNDPPLPRLLPPHHPLWVAAVARNDRDVKVHALLMHPWAAVDASDVKAVRKSLDARQEDFMEAHASSSTKAKCLPFSNCTKTPDEPR